MNLGVAKRSFDGAEMLHFVQHGAQDPKEECVPDESDSRLPLSEADATRLAWQAVELAGGTRMVYRSPRQAFSAKGRETFAIDGHTIEVRWGEISSPAIVTVGGYVFEILDEGIALLVRPPRPRANP
jgi:hypothetical protein